MSMFYIIICDIHLLFSMIRLLNYLILLCLALFVIVSMVLQFFMVYLFALLLHILHIFVKNVFIFI